MAICPPYLASTKLEFISIHSEVFLDFQDEASISKSKLKQIYKLGLLVHVFVTRIQCGDLYSLNLTADVLYTYSCVRELLSDH